MTRTRIIGPCLLAVCAMFALTASSASASFENLPHFGKCVAKTGGKYSNSGCTKLAKTVETEKYEWEPLATTVPFTSLKEKETGEAELEGKKGIEIFSSGQKEKFGEYGPGDQVKNVVGEFTGVKALGAPCNSASHPVNSGEVDTFKLKGEPGIVKHELKEEKNIVGNDLVPESGTELANFVCTGVLTVVVKKGIVTEARADGVNNSNKMNNKIEVEFNAEKPGKQIPNEWEPNFGGISHTGTRGVIHEQLETSFNSEPEEDSGQTLTTVQSTSGTKPKLELRMCEKTISCPN